jgi:hypothetical protein
MLIALLDLSTFVAAILSLINLLLIRLRHRRSTSRGVC